MTKHQWSELLRMVSRIIRMAALFPLFLQYGYGAPAPTDYTCNVTTDGSAITLIGASFGSKNASKFIFDQMESGFDTGWSTTGFITINNNPATQRDANSNGNGFVSFDTDSWKPSVPQYGGQIKAYFTGGTD